MAGHRVSGLVSWSVLAVSSEIASGNDACNASALMRGLVELELVAYSFQV